MAGCSESRPRHAAVLSATLSFALDGLNNDITVAVPDFYFQDFTLNPFDPVLNNDQKVFTRHPKRAQRDSGIATTRSTRRGVATRRT
jgi:hypothetical protein